MATGKTLKDGTGEEERLAVHRLLNNRLETVPWHCANVGPEIQELRTWEHVTLLTMLQKKTTLCAYDTLGILTHLCLTLDIPATYHSERDLYAFPETPQGKVINDPLNMPPKHPFFYERKYDQIATSYLFSNAVRKTKIYPLLGTMRKLLAPKGAIVVSECPSDLEGITAAADAAGLQIRDQSIRPGRRGSCFVARLETE